jgi:signal transduction histidine kinase
LKGLTMDALKLIRRSPVVFPLAVLAAVAMLFISEGSYWQSADALRQLSAERDARAQVLDLRKNILDAETGQRGYLLTGRAEFLAPYDTALEPIGRLLQDIDAHYSSNPNAKTVVDKLTEQVKARLSLIAETIRLKQAGKSDLINEALLTAFGKDQFDDIHQLGNRLLELGATSVSASRESVDGTLLLGRIGVIALTAISLLALFIYLRHAAAAEAVQLELKRTIQAERDQLEIVVARRTEVLTSLAQHLQIAREDERQRLARNLHDELGALLTSAKLDAARIKSRLAGMVPEALERLAHLVETLNASIALGRSIIEDLRPSTLANLGLVSAIEILAREFGERSGVHVHRALAPVKLRASAELMVYRLVQEAITNISKYAKAQQVWVAMASHDGQVLVSVRDDGVGFDSASQPGSAYGLVGMRFRVEAEHGKLEVVSAPGQGTTVQARLPESL